MISIHTTFFVFVLCSALSHLGEAKPMHHQNQDDMHHQNQDEIEAKLMHHQLGRSQTSVKV
jgi:hypothetical protein